MIYSHSVKGWLLLFLTLLLSCGSDQPQMISGDPDHRAATIAGQLLDDEIEAEERRALVEEHPDLSSDILKVLVHDLETDTEEEADRIPWIWRVTVAAGSRNDAEEIRDVLNIALPQVDSPLLNWQGVVIGGGIINGIGRDSDWATDRIPSILEGHQNLQERWQHSISQSYKMAGDPNVPYPWRYDALRIIAMDSHDRAIPELASYLNPDFDSHLHMGAIAGLSDIRSPEVPELLLSGFSHYSDQNRNRALDALLRTEDRIAVLIEAVSSGVIPVEDLDEEQIDVVRDHDSNALQ